MSFVSVMIFLPAFTLLLHKLIDKTEHRRLVPRVDGIGQIGYESKDAFLILALIVVIPCFLAQTNTQFLYGTGSVAGVSEAGKDRTSIEDEFGRENALVLLVPRGDVGREAELCRELKNVPHVKTLYLM